MTTLALAVDADDELWTLDDLPTPEAPYVEVGSELIEVRSRFPSSYYTLTGETLPPRIRVRRGIAGTTKASHIQGSTLTPNYGLGSGGGGGAIAVTGTVSGEVAAATALELQGTVTDEGGGVAGYAPTGGGGVAVLDAVSADIGTLAQISVSDTDPGAVGAGNMWLQTDPTDNALNLQLWLRTEADDGWIAVGVGDTFEGGLVSGFRAIDALGIVLASVKVDPATGISELIARIPGDTGKMSIVSARGIDGLYLSGDGNAWQSAQQAISIVVGDEDPTAGAGVDMPNGSLYIRPDGGGGAGKIYQLAGGFSATDWLQLFAIPATLPEVPAAPTEQDIVDALVTLGLVTQAV